MRARLILLMTLGASAAAAWADDSEPVQTVSTVQAHLQAMAPPAARPPSAAPALARLVGKLLAEHIQDVHVELESDAPTPAAPALNQGSLRLNRRAELCFDNYRLGFKRDGLVMRYERSF